MYDMPSHLSLSASRVQCSSDDPFVGSNMDVLDVGERELVFTFAVCYRPSVSSVCRLSVVCNACAPRSAGRNFRHYLYGISYLGHPLTSTENFTEIIPEEPLHRGS